MMTPSQRYTTRKALKGALALVKQGWTQRTLACDKDGTPCPMMADRACKFCIVSAATAATRAIEALYQNLKGASRDWNALIDFNDHPDTSHEDVVTLFERTIASL